MTPALYKTSVLSSFVIVIVAMHETCARYSNFPKTTNKPVFGLPQFSSQYDSGEDIYFVDKPSISVENDVTYEEEIYDDKDKEFENDEGYNNEEQYFKEGAESDTGEGLQFGFMDQSMGANNKKFVINRDPIGLPFVSVDGQVGYT